ncbi:hypothetical protein glysoja_006014 [Glycine soja]|nr:hypothetical protein glysoja_006014 [Glycine soja]
MATTNPFDLLGDDAEDPSQLIAAEQLKAAAAAAAGPPPPEMTLEEYEKVLEERRKAFQALKTEERKVDTKEFESMQALSSKKDNHDIFIKLGSDKDKRKEAFEKEEKSKKSVSITEFLKPAEGEAYYNPGRGRGRGRGSRGGGGYHGSATNNAPAPSIEDPGHFPTLSAK